MTNRKKWRVFFLKYDYTRDAVDVVSSMAVRDIDDAEEFLTKSFGSGLGSSFWKTNDDSGGRSLWFPALPKQGWYNHSYYDRPMFKNNEEIYGFIGYKDSPCLWEKET